MPNLVTVFEINNNAFQLTIHYPGNRIVTQEIDGQTFDAVIPSFVNGGVPVEYPDPLLAL